MPEDKRLRKMSSVLRSKKGLAEKLSDSFSPVRAMV
jgi:hypothetical protein